MKALKDNLSKMILSICEILVGVLLLINPVGFTKGIIIAAGSFLIIIGIVDIIKYFRINAVSAAVSQFLAKGLIAIVIGAFCILKTNWFVITFPVLTMIYGVIILIAGLGKVQMTVDMIRLKKSGVILFLISALLSLACAVIIIMNPFESTKVLWMFIGITLIIEALCDFISTIVSGTKKIAENAASKVVSEQDGSVE